MDDRLERMQLSLGRIETRQLAALGSSRISEWEFQVFSQWGEDGMLQYLISVVPIERKIFAEFGVQDYTESNTRFLLQKDNWSGLVIDGSAENVAAIRRDPLYWRYNLKAECAFVTRENINELITVAGLEKDIGLLSIDIDGNDYWVWETVTCVAPRIVVIEYNSLFGPDANITIPYNPTFVRGQVHHSNLYWGASIGALARLGNAKGYALVGSNSAGNNAFFVRRDILGPLQEVSPQHAWVQAHFRESRDRAGNLNFLDPVDAIKEIHHLPVVDVNKGVTLPLEKALAVRA